MRTFIILLLFGALAYGQGTSDPGLQDPETLRYYLRDIRQVLCWIVGLQLVSLTKIAWTTWRG